MKKFGIKRHIIIAALTLIVAVCAVFALIMPGTGSRTAHAESHGGIFGTGDAHDNAVDLNALYSAAAEAAESGQLSGYDFYITVSDGSRQISQAENGNYFMSIDSSGNLTIDALYYGDSQTFNLYLSENFYHSITVEDEGTVNLCLNGQMINVGGTTGDSGAISVSGSSVIFNLYDCGTAQHYYTVDNDTGLWSFGEFSDGAFTAFTSSDSSTYVTGGVITGGSAVEGGGIYVDDAEFNMYGGTVAGNTATNAGGGIYLTGYENTNICGGTVAGNIAATYGGGIYAYAPLYLRGGTVACNRAQNGGGIYVDNSGYLYMYGGSVSENSATYGGGINVPVEGGDCYLYGGEISDNTATYGGGIYADDFVNITAPSDGTVITQALTISGNHAGVNGGGIYIAGGETAADLTISAECNITANSAGEYGGGIYISGDGDYPSNAYISAGSISGNSSVLGGGGVYYDVEAESFNISGTVQIAGNTTNGNADNLYVSSGKTVTVGALEEGADIGITADADVSDSFIELDSSAAGVTLADLLNYIKSDDDSYTLAVNEDGTGIESVTSSFTVTVGDGAAANYSTISEAFEAARSAATSADSYAVVKMFANATITSTLTVADGDYIVLDLNGHVLTADTASGDFSVITVESDGSFILQDSNSAATNTIGETEYYGGVITGGSAASGGGVYVAGTFTMEGGTIAGNSAYTAEASSDSESGRGGGVYVTGTFNMNGGAVSDNLANIGGGVSVYRNGTMTMSDGAVISGNTAKIGTVGGSYSAASSGLGGGINVYYGTFTMNGGEISGNEAAPYDGAEDFAKYGEGGGLYIHGTTATINGGTISSNNAGHNGGGIYVHVASTLTMNGGTIGGSEAGNTAVYFGGGVYVNRQQDSETACGTFNMVNGAITYNTALCGGGIYSHSGSSGAAIVSLTATGSNSIVIQHNSAVSGNNLDALEGTGGGAYIGATGTHCADLDINGNVTITENLADSTADNLYLAAGVVINADEGGDSDADDTYSLSGADIGVTLAGDYSGSFIGSGYAEGVFESDKGGDIAATDDGYTIGYTITVNPTVNGQVNGGTAGSTLTILHGSSVTYTVEADSGYHVASVSLGIVEGNSGTITYAQYAAAASKTLSVIFEINSYTVTVAITGSGTVGNGGTIAVTSANTGDSAISLELLPSSGYYVSSVSGANVSQNGGIFSLSYSDDLYSQASGGTEITLNVTFAAETYSVSFANTGSAAFEGSGTSSITYGSEDITIGVPVLAGYTFVGWQGSDGTTTDSAAYVLSGSRDYGENGAVITLTAQWNLAAPAVTLAGGTAKTYDGNAVTLTATAGHSAASGVAFTYSWYKDGSPVSGGGNTLEIVNVADSGVYTVTVGITYSGAITVLNAESLPTVTSDGQTVTINPAQVAVSWTVDGQSVTGNAYSTTYKGSAFTITANADGAGALVPDGADNIINASDRAYEITVSYAGNYTLTNNTLYLTVNRADPAVDVSVSAPETVYTSHTLGTDITISLVAGSTAGTISWDEGQTLSVENSSYSWTFTPDDTTNYNAATGNYTINVTAVELTSIEITSGPTKMTYQALERFESDGLEVTAHYNDGSTAIISDYTITVAGNGTGDMTLNYGTDGQVGVTVSYGGYSDEITVTVTKIGLSVPAANTGLVYDGSLKTGVYDGEHYSVTGNTGTDARTYNAIATLDDSENYAWEGTAEASVSISWSIAAADIQVTVTPYGGIYDGQAHAAATYNADTQGSQTAVWTFRLDSGTDSSAMPEVTDADTYTLYYTVTAPNHNEKTGSVTVTVGKKALAADMFTITGAFTYDGAEQTLTADDYIYSDGAANLTADDFAITNYANNINAGENSASVTFTAAQDGNYSGTATVNFSIGKATLTAKADDKQVTYGNAAPEYTVSYSGWAGNDEGTYALDTAPVADSDYTAGTSVSLSGMDITVSGGEDSNYNFSYVSGTLTINQAAGSITAATTSGSYAYGTAWQDIALVPGANNVGAAGGWQWADASATAQVENDGYAARIAVDYVNYSWTDYGTAVAAAEDGTYYYTVTVAVAVTPLTITVSWNYGGAHEYDGRPYYPTATITDGLLEGDEGVTLTYSGDTGATDAGTGYSVTAAPSSSNYVVAEQNASQAFEITAKELTAVWSVDGEQQDGNALTATYKGSAFEVTAAADTGVDGQSVSITYTYSGDLTDASQSAYTVTAAIDGNANYVISEDSRTFELTIQKFTISGVEWSYTNSAVSGGAPQSISGEGATVAYNANDYVVTATAAAADGSTTLTLATQTVRNCAEGGYTVTAQLTDETNYQFGSSAVTGISFEITRITINAEATATDRDYNGTNAVQADITLPEAIPSDNVTYSYVSATMADANAGTGKAVTITGLALVGDNEINYVLASSEITATVDIYRVQLTISGTSVSGRDYNGSNDISANVTPGEVSGIIAAGSGGVTVYVAGATLSSADAGSRSVTVEYSVSDTVNYIAPAAETIENVTISPVTVQASDFTWTVNNGVENLTSGDGGYSSAYTGKGWSVTATLSGVNGESFTAVLSGAENILNAGTYTVTVTGITPSESANAANYTGYADVSVQIVVERAVLSADDISWTYSNGELGGNVEGATLTYNGGVYTISASIEGVNETALTLEMSENTFTNVSDSGEATASLSETARVNYCFGTDIYSVARQITISPKAVTVTWLLNGGAWQQSVNYSESGYTVTLSTDGILPDDSEHVLISSYNVNGSIVSASGWESQTFTERNTYTVNARIYGNDYDNYQITSGGSATLSIGIATLSPELSLSYDGTFTLNAGGSGADIAVTLGTGLPEGLSVEFNVSYSGVYDGQYSVGEVTYSEGTYTATITVTSAGTYRVTAAVEDQNNNYTIDAAEAQSATINWLEDDGAAYGAGGGTYFSGSTYWAQNAVSIAAQNGYTLAATVAGNYEQTLAATTGSYTFYFKNNQNQVGRATVTAALDATAPSAELGDTSDQDIYTDEAAGEKYWVFAAGSVPEVTLTCSDGDSGIATRQYYWDTEGSITPGEDITGWNDYTAAISAQSGVLWVMVTDNVGNVSYASASFAQYTPVEDDDTGYSYTKLSGADLAVSLGLGGNTFVSIAGENIAAGNYTETYIDDAFLDELAMSGDSQSFTFTVTYNPAGLESTSIKNEVANTFTFVVRVQKAALTADDFTFIANPHDGNFVYDGTAYSATVRLADNTYGAGDLTVYYNGATEQPKNAGEYTVSVSAGGSSYYRATSENLSAEDWTLNISKKQVDVAWSYTAGEGDAVQISGGTANVPYGFTYTVTAISGQEQGVVDGDTLTLDVTGGDNLTDITVHTVTVEIAGENSNYVLNSLQTEITLNIVTATEGYGSISFGGYSTVLTYGDSFSVSANYAAGEEQTVSDGTITYSSSDMSVATVNSATGEITLLKAGTFTITAIWEREGYADLAETTAEITVSAKELTVEWTVTSGDSGKLNTEDTEKYSYTVTYNGNTYTVSAAVEGAGTDNLSEALELVGDYSGLVNANEDGYRAEASLAAAWQDRYSLAEGSAEFTLTIDRVDITAVDWVVNDGNTALSANGGEFSGDYTGKVWSVSATANGAAGQVLAITVGLQAVQGNFSDRAILNAGVYTATAEAIAAGDGYLTGNYSLSEGISVQITVNKVVLSADDIVWTYTHGDDSGVEYSSGATYTYDGQQWEIAAAIDGVNGESPTLAMSGNIFTNANEEGYSVTADLDESIINYTLEQGSITFVLARAEITAADYAVSVPEDAVYSAAAYSVEITSWNITGYGTYQVVYYDNADRTGNPVQPVNAGTYYAFIDVEAGVNYKQYTALIATYKVSPMTLSADDISWTYSNGELGGDVEGATLTYNGGEYIISASIEGVNETTLMLEMSGNTFTNVSDSGEATASLSETASVNYCFGTDIYSAARQITISPRQITPNLTIDGVAGNSFTYDGERHAIGAVAETGVSGEGIILSVSKNSATYVSDGGEITVSIANVTGGAGLISNYELTTDTFTLTVNMATVNVSAPVAESVRYGTVLSDIAITGGIFDGVSGSWGWNEENADGIYPAVGGTATYTARIAVDAQNYDWSDIEGYADGYYSVEITPAVTKATLIATATSITRTYGEAAPAEYEIIYSGWVAGDSAENYTLGTAPVAASDYTAGTPVSQSGMAITVSGGSDTNYDFRYENGTITILKATLAADNFSYSAPSELVYSGTRKTAVITSLLEGVAAGDLTVKYSADGQTYTAAQPVNADTYYVFIDVAETANYSAAENITAADWTFTVQTKDISGADITLGGSLTYNGGQQEQTVVSVTVDGLNVTYTVSGNAATNAGSYTLTVTGNGNFSGTAAAQYAIAAKNITISWSGSSFTYNGGVQVPVATAEGAVAGDSLAFTYSGDTQAANAGSYSVTAAISDSNYNILSGAQCSFTIGKARLAVPVAAENITYNGDEQTYLPEGFDENLMEISGNTVTEAGDYTATIVLKDTANYEWADGTTAPVTVEFTVAEAEVDIVWVLVVLSVIVAAELIILIPVIRRRKRLSAENNGDDGPDGEGSGPDGGTPSGGDKGGSGAALLAAAPLALMASEFVPAGQVGAAIALGAVAVVLAVTEIALSVRRKKKQPAAEPLTDNEPVPAEEPAAQPVSEAAAAEQPEEHPAMLTAIPAADEDGLIAVRYNYSFMAKLIQSSPEIQQRYCNIMDLAKSYKKVKTVMSWKQVRIYSGRKTLSLMVFKCKKLCITFALNPAEFAETKYRGLDVSGVKRYEKTPMMLKLTSDRRGKYSEYLFSLMCGREGLEQGDMEHTVLNLPYETREQLIRRNLIKIAGTSGAGEIERVDRETFIREQQAMREAAAELAPFADERGMVLVRYDYSFKAKLIQSAPDVQKRYGGLYDFVLSYNGIKAPMSWKKVRVYSGRNIYAQFTFRGKKLCMSFALNPAEFAETKYRGLDMSGVKKYERTPMMLKLTSDRKAGYAKYLFNLMMEREGIAQGEIVETAWEYPYETRSQLIEERLVKVVSVGSGSGAGEAEMVDITTAIRERLAMRRAEADAVEENTETAETEPGERADECAQAQAEEEQPVDIQQLVRDSVNISEASEMLTDSQAEKLIDTVKLARIEGKESPASKAPRRKVIINIDSLSANFSAGETITLETLKQKGLVPAYANTVKVLARGTIDKPLTVEADDFSMDAVKMIVLTGGHAVKIKR